MAQKRIAVTTFGSLGDLHPYLALALGLRARGHDVIVATGECYRNKIGALGLGFAAVRPDSAWVTDPEKGATHGFGGNVGMLGCWDDNSG